MRSTLHLLGLLVAGLFVTVFFPPEETEKNAPPHAFIEPDSLHQGSGRIDKIDRHISFYDQQIKKVNAEIKERRSRSATLFQQLRTFMHLIELKANREDLQENLDWWRRYRMRLLMQKGHVVADNISAATTSADRKNRIIITLNTAPLNFSC